MGLLPATFGIGSNWTCWRLLRHLRPLYPAPAAWRLSQLAPRITKSDTAGEVLEALVGCLGVVTVSHRNMEVYHAAPDADWTYPP
jgi:hypothetical protein